MPVKKKFTSKAYLHRTWLIKFYHFSMAIKNTVGESFSLCLRDGMFLLMFLVLREEGLA